MTRPVPLIRRFTPISHLYQDQDVQLEHIWKILGDGERVGWPDLEDLYRVVILADPGAGKTFELRAQAQIMAARGRAAFFIRIEDIDVGFGAAFEVGNAGAFEAWLDGVEEAWFFLDSVDEVRLETPRAFEAALRAFAGKIHDARQRAHVIVSSRPYAWDFKLDNALVKELLPYDPPTDHMDEDDDRSPSAGARDSADDPLRFFRLAPLDVDDIRIFAGHRGMTDTDGFIEALDRAALFDLAQRPFDLEDLVAIWSETGKLDSRLHVLERGLERRLAPEPGTSGGLSAARALSGARRLALAATLMNEANIRLPGGQTGGLDAVTLLADWPESDIQALLARGVFSDAIYSAVRFRHRETRELLAAQQLVEILSHLEGRGRVEALLFRTVYGREIIPPRVRPILPWLILYDEAIRNRALGLAPEIATEGGDAARLPLDGRRGILNSLVFGIVESGDRGGDNTAIARIAQDDLSDAALALIEKFGDHDDAIFFLGRLVWQGVMKAPAEALIPIALDPNRGDYARVVSARAAAVLGAETCHDLWTDLNGTADILPRRLLAQLVNSAPLDATSVDLLIASIDKLEPYAQFRTTGLTQAIYGFIDRLPLIGQRASQPLGRLLEGLAGFLAREPHLERGDCGVSQAFSWLMGPAMRAAERLVIGRSQACFGSTALFVMSQAPILARWGVHEHQDRRTKLGDLIPRWPELNDALFWHSVAQTRARLKPGEALTDDWDVDWIGRFWAFDAASFPRTLSWVRGRDLADDRSLALSRCFRTYVQGGRPKAWRRALWGKVTGDSGLEAKLAGLMRPPASPKRRLQRDKHRRWAEQSRNAQAQRDDNHAAWIARLRADPELVRTPPSLTSGQMTRDQLFVLQHLPDYSHLGRGAAGAFPILASEFGAATAEAFRDAAMGYWRGYWPELRSERADDSGIPYGLIFGMVGLEFEAGEDGAGLGKLSPSEVERALRYVPRELNGFPSWFEPLYRAHPQSGLALIWGETRWELANSSPESPMHYVLHDLVYHAPWLHADLSTLIHSWIAEHGAVSQIVLSYARSIMVSGGLAPDAIAALASKRICAESTPADQLPTWFALWVDAAPQAAVPVLAARLKAMAQPDDARFAEQFLVSLVGGRNTSVGPMFGAWRAPATLKTLHLLMHQHIRVADDIDRANGGVYSPELRDDAQDARHALFSYLAQTPGEETYREIMDLADQHPNAAYGAWMRRKAYDRAVADGDISPSLAEVAALLGAD